MSVQSTQIRVTIPTQLQAHLQSKASKFGLSLSSYVKNLIIDDVKGDKNPVYMLSDSAIAAYKQAKKAEESGALIEADNLDELLESL